MKKFFLATGLALLVVAAVTLGTLRTIGYEPKDQSPGLWVTGQLVTEPISDWSFTDQFKEIFVQTNTWYWIPHSVNTYCTIYNGNLFLFSAYYQGGTFPEGRLWNRNVLRDPHVRLKIGDRLFDRTVRPVTGLADKEPVLQSFIEKYPEWSSPGIENVHMFLVEPL